MAKGSVNKLAGVTQNKNDIIVPNDNLSKNVKLTPYFLAFIVN